MKQVTCAVLCSFHLLFFVILNGIQKRGGETRYLVEFDFMNGMGWGILVTGLAAVISALACKRPKLAIVCLLLPILSFLVEGFILGGAINPYSVYGFILGWGICIIYWLFINATVFIQVSKLLSPTGELQKPQKQFTISAIFVCMTICSVVLTTGKYWFNLQGHDFDLGTVINFGLFGLTLTLFNVSLSPVLYRPSPYRWQALLLLGALCLLAIGTTLIEIASNLHNKENTLICDLVDSNGKQYSTTKKTFYFGGGYSTTDLRLRDLYIDRCQFFGAGLLVIAIATILGLCSWWLRKTKYFQMLFHRGPTRWQSFLLLLAFFLASVGIAFMGIGISMDSRGMDTLFGINSVIFFGCLILTTALAVVILVVIFRKRSPQAGGGGSG